MEIRVLTEADAARWRDLRLRMLREHPDAFGTSYEEALARPLETFAQRLREPDNWTLGAFEGEQLLGSVGLRREAGAKDRHKAMIWGMYTAPEARGRGIGKALLDEAIARARGARPRADRSRRHRAQHRRAQPLHLARLPDVRAGAPRPQARRPLSG